MVYLEQQKEQHIIDQHFAERETGIRGFDKNAKLYDQVLQIMKQIN
jgi:hypothetical protein